MQKQQTVVCRCYKCGKFIYEGESILMIKNPNEEKEIYIPFCGHDCLTDYRAKKIDEMQKKLFDFINEEPSEEVAQKSE